jgi:hypothetical protein
MLQIDYFSVKLMNNFEPLYSQIYGTPQIPVFCNIPFIQLVFLKINTYLTSVVQQPYGYNATGQLQEPKDLNRPATAKIVFTILLSPEASLLQA